ncbi:MAG: cyclodeaminase/cyclohydrolase family protein [Aeromicrobium sp.]
MGAENDTVGLARTGPDQGADPKVRDENVTAFLLRLAARTPTPAGGAVAALNAAQAASLVAMVARYADASSPEDGEVQEAAARADRLRERALDLATEDGEAFASVADAYALPSEGAGAAERRGSAIRDALARAALPQAAVVTVAHGLVELAGLLLPTVSASMQPDLAAASNAAYAAASTARLNVEANLRGLDDDDDRRAVLRGLGDVDELLRRASELHETVRRGVVA